MPDFRSDRVGEIRSRWEGFRDEPDYGRSFVETMHRDVRYLLAVIDTRAARAAEAADKWAGDPAVARDFRALLTDYAEEAS